MSRLRSILNKLQNDHAGEGFSPDGARRGNRTVLLWRRRSPSWCSSPTRRSRLRRRSCRRPRRRPGRRRDRLRRPRRPRSVSNRPTITRGNASLRPPRSTRRRSVLGAAEGKQIVHPRATSNRWMFRRSRNGSTRRPSRFRTESRRPPPRAPTTWQRQSTRPSRPVSVEAPLPPGRGGGRSARTTRSASSRLLPKLNRARAHRCSASESRSTPSTTNGSRSVRGDPAVTDGPASIAARPRSEDSKARRIGGPEPNGGRVATVDGSLREPTSGRPGLLLNRTSPLMQTSSARPQRQITRFQRPKSLLETEKQLFAPSHGYGKRPRSSCVKRLKGLVVLRRTSREGSAAGARNLGSSREGRDGGAAAKGAGGG